jgi:hypothetical protein
MSVMCRSVASGGLWHMKELQNVDVLAIVEVYFRHQRQDRSPCKVRAQKATKP